MLRSALLAGMAGIWCAPGAAWAHGGEVHGAEAPAAPAPTAAGMRVAHAQTERFEIVVKHPVSEAGAPAPVRVLLADYATNTPIAEATVALDFSGPGAVTATAREGAPGVYEATVTFPAAGVYELLAAITTRDATDLIPVPGVRIEAPGAAAAVPGGHPPAAAAHTHAPAVPLWAWALLAPVLVGGVAAALLRRRRRRSGAGPVAIALVLTCSPSPAAAHGGERHDGAPPAQVAAPPGAPIALAKESQFLLGVLTEVVGERAMRDRIVAFGTIVPRTDRHADLFAAQPGRILPGPAGRLPYLGERVQRGRTLLVIEASLSAADLASLGAQRIQAEVRVGQAEAALRQAERDVERAGKLAGVVSARDAQNADTAVEIARQEVERARRERDLLTSGRGGGLSRFPVTSPIDGVVGAIEVAAGEQVDGARTLLTVFDPAVLWVGARVHEADLGRIEGAADAAVAVEAFPGEQFAGTLFALAPQVDPTTRTAKAVFEVANPDGRLRPGMSADVQIAAGPARGALAVPGSALVSVDGRQVVFVHTAPEEFVRREVAVGSRDGAYWSVRGGLSPGERVVVQGVHQLRSAGGR